MCMLQHWKRIWKQVLPFTCSRDWARGAKTKTTPSRRPMRRERRGGAFDPRAKRSARPRFPPASTARTRSTVAWITPFPCSFSTSSPSLRRVYRATTHCSYRYASIQLHTRMHTTMRSCCNALRLILSSDCAHLPLSEVRAPHGALCLQANRAEGWLSHYRASLFTLMHFYSVIYIYKHTYKQ